MILLPHYVQLLFIVVGLFAGNSVVDSANVTLCDSGNEKVQVTESEFDSEIKELQWVGDDRKLFAVTASGRLYRSMDGGKSWNDIVDKLEGLEISVDSRFAFGTGVSSVWATSNPELTLVLGHEKRVWTINDITNNYAYQDFEGVVSHITPHPSKPDALVQTSSDRCFNRTAPGACRSALWHYSLTTPTQVTLITHDVVQFEWSDEGRILVSTWDKSMDDPNFTLHTYARDPSLIALYRHDPFAAPPRFDLVLPHCAGFLTTENALYVATRESGTSLTLWRATRLGADPPRKLGFPTTLQQTRFTICNAEEGSLFVNVQHGDSKWGNLYVSSANGTAGVDYQFVLSLERAARELNGQVQFAKFYGMPGVFLSNVREDSGLAGRLESILTVITWDNGGDWHALAAPSANDEGSRQFACRGIACHLHLHGVRKQRLHRDRFQRVEFGPLHTKANTVGLVMATGNVGLALSDSDVGVFLSRDAGSSWLALASGSHTYDFADHGALILMARNDEPTSVLGYTWNQGLNWTSCQFTSKPLVEIDNIEADPEAASEVLLMFGLDQATGRGYLAHVDFSSLHERACDETDYEFWRPAVGGLRCQLGVERTFKRRRRDAACYNKDVVESKPTEVICQCSRDDYACDSCFTPRMSSDLSTTHCVIDQACMRHRQTDEGAAERRLEAPMSGVGPNGDLPPPDCAPGRHYYVSRGYTLVGNTRCNTAGGVDLFPLSLPCPAAAPDSGGVGGGVVVLLVLLVLIGVAVLAALAFVWWRRRSAPPSLQYGTLQDSDNDDDDDDYEQTHGVESADSDFTSNN